jgi:hypothetical protein
VVHAKVERRINEVFCNDGKLVWNIISHPNNSDALDLHLCDFQTMMVVVIKKKGRACVSH